MYKEIMVLEMFKVILSKLKSIEEQVIELDQKLINQTKENEKPSTTM